MCVISLLPQFVSFSKLIVLSLISRDFIIFCEEWTFITAYQGVFFSVIFKISSYHEIVLLSSYFKPNKFWLVTVVKQNRNLSVIFFWHHLSCSLLMHTVLGYYLLSRIYRVIKLCNFMLWKICEDHTVLSNSRSLSYSKPGFLILNLIFSLLY